MEKEFKRVCSTKDLTEKGSAIGFEVDAEQFLNGFVVLFNGKPYAYLNRCPHVGTELDWVPGVVFDEQKTFLSCATHGALFDPVTGGCVRGPCINQFLVSLVIHIEDDNVMVAV
ncbi:MAG: Rieske 2Fe-2S domain-containing protein [Gammaproteobacteria bacterium]|nr:Rieske 2Fe-2S domain-containing protein [Gammaproteobacteria bacterium]